MRCLIILSALLIVLAQCGYPIPSYPLPKTYAVPPAYPSAPVYSAVPVVAVEEEESGFFAEGGSAAAEFRKRAKARTVQNRKAHRRAPLQPIRRFQQKKQ